jgi:hypothetical protein
VCHIAQGSIQAEDSLLLNSAGAETANITRIVQHVKALTAAAPSLALFSAAVFSEPRSTEQRTAHQVKGQQGYYSTTSSRPEIVSTVEFIVNSSLVNSGGS